MPDTTHKNAALMNAWKEECEKAAGGIINNKKGLFLDESALVRIGTAIEALASPAPQAEEADLPPLPSTNAWLWPLIFKWEANFKRRVSLADSVDLEVSRRMRAYALAARADLLKQIEELKEDAERLDVLEAAVKTGKRLSYHKKNFSLVGLTNYEYDAFKTLREAIDACKEQTK